MCAVRLDEGEIASYRELGYARLGPVLDAGEIQVLLREEERFRLPVAYAPEGRGTLFVNIHLCDRSEPIRRVCTLGPQIGAVNQLLGPDVCLTHQQFVTKLPDAPSGAGSSIPLHQDNGYGTLEPMTDVTVWIPLVDADEESGGLFVVPGSHRLGLLPHGHGGENPVLLGVEGEFEAIPVPLRAGEALAFSGLTLHGSGPNRSGAARPAFYVRYCDPRAVVVNEDSRRALDAPSSWMVAGEAP
jgi:phytanoyl-CoA hydroxylase